jgi:pseudaminic acid cytidylyltransferase
VSKCVAIIPARSGSRRIPGKNIKEFHGKPIISYSINAAIDSKIFDRVIVSTDSEEIAKVARQYGAEVIMRSEEMSRDEVGTQEVMAHVLKDIECDFAACVYPCVPMIDIADLKFAFAMLENNPVIPYVIPIATWMRDPGQFYFGWRHAFTEEVSLMWGQLMQIVPDIECDINTPEDWSRAEQMFAKLHGMEDYGI